MLSWLDSFNYCYNIFLFLSFHETKETKIKVLLLFLIEWSGGNGLLFARPFKLHSLTHSALRVVGYMFWPLALPPFPLTSQSIYLFFINTPNLTSLSIHLLFTLLFERRPAARLFFYSSAQTKATKGIDEWEWINEFVVAAEMARWAHNPQFH